MKKGFILFIIALIIFVNPLSVFAEEDLNISSWIVESELLENGSLSVVKDITYDFNTYFNGVYVDISLDNIIEIDDLHVYEIVNGQELEYVQNQRAKKGENAAYSVDPSNNNINIMIFSPSENESKTFRLKYLLNDVAAIHADTGELFYKFIGKNNATHIDYFKADIILPKFNQDDIKIFGHGPLNGNISFENQSIRLDVENVPSETFIEARVVFPLDYIPLATRTGNRSLNDILNEERALVEKAKENEIKREERKSLFNNISIGLTAGGLLILGVILNKFKRHPDLFNEMKSIHPDDISPAELSLFMNSIIGPRSYIATLLDLARREYISFEKVLSDKKISKWNKSDDLSDYLFIRNNTSSNNLLEHEKYLLDWFFNDIGDGHKVSTDDIDYYRKNNSSKFHKSQTAWIKIVRRELLSRKLYDSGSNKYGVLTLIISLILLAISIITLVFEGLFGIALLVLSIIMLVYSIFLFSRKSDKGYIQYRLWKDFKKNNNNIDIKNLGLSTDLSLIYLIALGLPMKDLDEYRQSIGMDYYPMHWGYFYFLTNSKGGSSFEDKFSNSFYGSTGSSTATSSSFGGGGGFTGGGGGGVGGSGSGGF
ncbi:MAG: DUF2207 domain-containing protein [Tissierellaceae bacterium]|nr:DUF2207 domain-containing protein [Tissierellaceae bacterium]